MTIEEANKQAEKLIDNILGNRGKTIVKAYPTVVRALKTDLGLSIYTAYYKGKSDSYKEMLLIEKENGQ